MTRPSTEVEGIESAIPRSKGGMDILCEITRTCDPSAPGLRFYEGSAAKPLRPRNCFARDSAHNCSPTLTSRRSHLTTGTFNLLSKTESAFRLSGAFQSNASFFE